MKSCSGALATFLGSSGAQTAYFADLYTFTLSSGVVARYATGEGLNGLSLINANTFSFDISTLVIERGKITNKVGMQVAILDLKISAAVTHLISGVPFLQACRQGILDGAYVKHERLVMSYPGDTSLGTVIAFTGRVADMDVGRFQVDMRVNADTDLLSQNFPHNLFQPACLNTVFDTNCTRTKSAYAASGTIASGSTKTSLLFTSAQPTGYFAQGTITFATGQLAGLSASISAFNAGSPAQAILIAPLIIAPSAGDTFYAYPGCDKQLATCVAKFANSQHYRGTDLVPTPESIL